MHIISPRRMSALISVIASVLVVVVFVLGWAYSPRSIQDKILLGSFFALLTFLGIFVIMYYLIKELIFEKVNPIYKTIQQLNLSDSELKEFLEGKDIGKQLEGELSKWALKKGGELTRLREMERYRKEFLGNVSHELKTPIFNIQGYILTLLDGGIDDSSINRVYLQRAENSINRMISIVEDLEEISKLESGVLKLNFEKFNMVSLVYEIADSLEMKASQRNISIGVSKSRDAVIYVNADKKSITQVVVNLLVNSINYGKEGGTTIVSFSDMFDRILVEVSDDGAGIDQKDINRIFERFFRADKSRSRESGGTGLGLAIVKHIIEAHKQTINVRSKLGEGSSFAFTLCKA